jgi:DNA-binding winged helix-turn-helix (wHTH) protein/tetratricopeptide (TPR) repeat protein/TolB-like protein
MYRFGSYTLDEETCLLRQGDQILPVPPKAAALLAVLVEAEGGLVSKERLLETVWPDAFVEESNVTQQIFLLRKLLKPEGESGDPIQTIPRRGYRFTWAVERVLPATLEPAVPQMTAAAVGQAEPVPGPRAQAKAAGGMRRLWVAVAVLAVIVAGVTVWARIVSGRESRDRTARVAVLGFTNMTEQPGDAWLSSALREMFSTDLSGVLSVKVLPPESVERAEKELRLTRLDGLSAQTLGELHANLDCDEVLTGSYVISGDQIRLDTHLLDARTGKVLFNYTATRATSELLPLVEQTGTAMRPELGVKEMAPGGQEAAEATVSRNPEAYRLYIDGMERERAYDGRAAVDLLQRSIALDPDFALAHLQLAGSYTVLGRTALASAEAHRAESLDAHLSAEQQLRITAGAQAADHDFDAAAATYRTLVQRYPENQDYRLLQAAYTMYAGRLEETVAELKPMLTGAGGAAKEPLLYSHLSDVYGKMGDWAASLEWATKGAEISRQRGQQTMYERLLTSETQGMLHLNRLPEALTRTQEALKIAREYGDDSGELRALNRLGQVETAMGDFAAAKSFLEEALKKEDATGETQREIYTESALGDVLVKMNQQPQAMTVFLEEQVLARSQNDAQTMLTADLDVARQELRVGRLAAGRADLERVVKQAGEVGDMESLRQARAALGR